MKIIVIQSVFSVPNIHPAPEMNSADIDRYIQYFMKNNVIPFTHKEFVRMFSLYRNYLIATNNAAPAYIEIINKLIGDRKLFKKMVFIRDSSYIDTEIDVNLDYIRIGLRSHQPDTIKTLINHMYHDYDKIYIHLFSGVYKYFTSIEDFIELKAEKDEYDKMMDGLDYYYDDRYEDEYTYDEEDGWWNE